MWARLLRFARNDAIVVSYIIAVIARGVAFKKQEAGGKRQETHIIVIARGVAFKKQEAGGKRQETHIIVIARSVAAEATCDPKAMQTSNFRPL